MSNVHNFNSGPSILPQTVYEQAAQAIHNFNSTGLSILEIGHRTPLFINVLEEAIHLADELLELNGEYDIMFLHGGASTQFFQLPMNFLPAGKKAAYLDCGTWGTKAIKEARAFGEVHLAGSSADKNYTYVPDELFIPEDAVYAHITSNNTIEGTQQHDWPATSIPLFVDMSSDILSRRINHRAFDVIYAGAQKNIGAAGVTLVAIKKDTLKYADRSIPTMLDYRQHIKNESMVNTPPVFAVFVCLLTLRWLKSQGGVAGIEPLNHQKADLLYNTLDSLPMFQPKVREKDRSLMNAVWVMSNEILEQKFLAEAKAEGMVGIKGHRTVGGFRASLYNALPLSSVVALTDLMKDFANRHG